MKPLSTIARATTVLSLALSGPVTIAQPANDNFANRGVISENSILVSSSLSGATSEPGEPFLPAISSGQTAWWTWIAPSNGIVTLVVNSNNFAPLVTIYTGESLPNLSLIASNNYLACYEHTICGCHERLRDQIAFDVRQGETYQIALDEPIVTDASWVLDPSNTNSLPRYVSIQTTNVSPGGPVSMTLNFTPAPANDDFAHAVPLSGKRTQTPISNFAATKEPGEPDHLGNLGGSSVWYSWTAPASGRVTLSTNNIPPYAPPSGGGFVIITGLNSNATTGPTCGREIDQEPPPKFFPIFAAYAGNSMNALTPANNTSLELGAYPNAIAFDAIKGETYHIAFDGNRGTTGNLNLYLALTKPASNDSFAKRLRLHGIYAVGTGFNAGATHEPGEPPPIPGSGGKSVWWTWTAPVSGPVYLGLEGSDYVGLPICVFIGSNISNLELFATGFGGGSTGATIFNAVAGQTYQISVSDWHGLTGAIRLTLQAPVVEVPLLTNISRSPQSALLSYSALNGQTILLQKCTDGRTWQDVGTALARQGNVSFLAKPAPGFGGTLYRAIIID